MRTAIAAAVVLGCWMLVTWTAIELIRSWYGF